MLTKRYGPDRLCSRVRNPYSVRVCLADLSASLRMCSSHALKTSGALVSSTGYMCPSDEDSQHRLLSVSVLATYKNLS